MLLLLYYNSVITQASSFIINSETITKGLFFSSLKNIENETENDQKEKIKDSFDNDNLVFLNDLEKDENEGIEGTKPKENLKNNTLKYKDNEFYFDDTSDLQQGMLNLKNIKILDDIVKNSIDKITSDPEKNDYDKNLYILFTNELKEINEQKQFINNLSTISNKEMYISTDRTLLEKLIDHSENNGIIVPGNEANEKFTYYFFYDANTKGYFLMGKQFNNTDIDENYKQNDNYTVTLNAFYTFTQAPLLSVINQQNASYYENTAIPTFYVIIKNEEIDKFIEKNITLAVKYRNVLRIALIPFLASSVKHEEIVGKTELPVGVLFKNDLIYKYDGTINENTLETFIDNHFKDTLSPIIKEEDVVDNTNKSLKTAVRSNAAEYIENIEKDTFVMFHAYWCGYCTMNIPVMEKLAELAKTASDKVEIIKIDLEKNSLPEYNVPHYPYFRLYKAKTNEAVEFNKDRNLEGYIDFIRENGHYKVDLSEFNKQHTNKVDEKENPNKDEIKDEDENVDNSDL